MHDHHQNTSTTRFPVAVDAALREADWQPGRWDIRQAEEWADALRSHTSPAGHRHAVFPAAVEAWAEFGGLHITATAAGRHIAPTTVYIDPLYGLHLARTLGDLSRALETEVSPTRKPRATNRPSSPSTPKDASTASTTPATGSSARTSTKPSPP
ncbi:hypothetical protein SCALM49S_01065 [Streptomyces californicus]